MTSNPTNQPGSSKVDPKIEQAKQQLEHMLDLNPQGMMLVQRDGVVVRLNRAMVELLGLADFKDALGKRLNVLLSGISDALSSRLLDGNGGHEVMEVPITFSDSRTRILRLTSVNSGNKNLSVVIVHDITGEREKAQNLEKKYKKEAIQALVGALMHNINQPLTVILVRAHLMRLAMEQSHPPMEELSRSLQDVVNLTMKIAETLRLLETPQDFITQPYVEGIQILDINRSSGQPDDKWKVVCTTVLDSLLALLDVHEPGAMRHAERTAAYAVRISRLMGFDETKVETVRYSAMYHDLGKLGLPDSILQKPSGLTADEKEIVNRHSEVGYNLLRSFPFLTAEAEAVYAHHEHYAGGGYPKGLSGQKIPLMARIVSVADAFDALRYHRYYHSSSPLEHAVEEIKSGSGTQFDPQIVQVFYICYRELDALFPHDPPYHLEKPPRVEIA